MQGTLSFLFGKLWKGLGDIWYLMPFYDCLFFLWYCAMIFVRLVIHMSTWSEFRTICLVSLIHAHKNAGWVLQNLWFLSNRFMVSSSMKLGWPLQWGDEISVIANRLVANHGQWFWKIVVYDRNLNFRVYLGCKKLAFWRSLGICSSSGTPYMAYINGSGHRYGFSFRTKNRTVFIHH